MQILLLFLSVFYAEIVQSDSKQSLIPPTPSTVRLSATLDTWTHASHVLVSLSDENEDIIQNIKESHSSESLSDNHFGSSCKDIGKFLALVCDESIKTLHNSTNNNEYGTILTPTILASQTLNGGDSGVHFGVCSKSMMFLMNKMMTNTKDFAVSSTSGADDFTSHAFHSWCAENIAIMPTLPKKKEGQFVEKYYLTLDPSSLPILNHERNGIIYATNTVSINDAHNEFKQTLSLPKNKFQYLQQTFEINKRLAKEKLKYNSNVDNKWLWAVSPFHRNYERELSQTMGEKSFFNVDVTSSASGKGMHLTFQYDLNITLHNQQIERMNGGRNYDEGDLRRSAKLMRVPSRGNVQLMFPISKQYFLDLDDPSPMGGNFGCQIITTSAYPSVPFSDSFLPSCRIDMDVSKQRVINIEQPSFASPQNVILLNVSFHFSTRNTLNNTESFQSDPFFIQIRFFSTIHTRYQNPIAKYVNVTVLSPIAYTGKIYDVPNNISYEFQPHNGVVGSQQTLKVCTGSVDDFLFVIVTTGIVSFIGALLSIYFLVKVSSWK